MRKFRAFSLFFFLAVMTIAGCDRSRLWHFLRGTGRKRAPADAVTPTMKDPERHDQFLHQIKAGEIGLLFLGDSITDWWPTQGASSWLRLASYRPANFGVAGDRTEHLLWRITHGELNGINPKVVVVLIGTNNIGQFNEEKPAWVANGIKQIVLTIRERLPDTRVLVLGIFPRGTRQSAERKKVHEVNDQIQTLEDHNKIHYLDLASAFLDSAGNIPADRMRDQLHLTAQGYDIWFREIQPVVEEMMK
jgi:lysophospholipase L1-like esterase